MEIDELQDSFVFFALTAILLLAVTHFICKHWLKRFPASTASGSLIMGLALYVGECLPQYHIALWAQKILMLEVLVVWIYGSFYLLHDFFLKEQAGDPSDRFGFSAWIVATVMVVIMIERIAPLLQGVILLLMIFAISLWMRYAWMVCKVIWLRIRNQFKDEVGPSLMLGAAATACIAWVLHIIFEDKIYFNFYQLLILISCLLYATVFMIVIRRWLVNPQQMLACWSADNALIYGVPSVIGMASSISRVLTETQLNVLLFWSIGWCLIVSSLDIINVVGRLSLKQFNYDVKQWLRIFSYCIVYIFAWTFYFEHPAGHYLIAIIAEHGLNVVTLLFAGQIGYSTMTARLTSHGA